MLFEMPMTRDDAGRYVFHRPLEADELLRAAEAVVSERMFREAYLNDPQVVIAFLKKHLALKPVECFCAVFLDSRLGVLAFETLAIGSIAATAVYPREVVKTVLHHNAAAVIFAHNHPSGSTQPSAEDRLLTERLVTALRTVDVRVLDHIVVGGNDAVSMAMLGMM